MRFRPCIDIHNGKVKQIVGGSLRDEGNRAEENFVASQEASFFAGLYRENGLRGGHIILLNAADSEYYEETKRQALEALGAYPDGMQLGGGITPENAGQFLDAGASHVIVTSYVFRDGRIRYDRLREMRAAVGRERLVLDVSCRRTPQGYRVVTDRWQRMTEEYVTPEFMTELSEYCDEFLVHAVDVEGKAEGIERELAGMLGSWNGIPITYAGGVHSMADVRQLWELGKGRLDVTVGSALDLFGGKMSWKEIMDFCEKQPKNYNCY